MADCTAVKRCAWASSGEYHSQLLPRMLRLKLSQMSSLVPALCRQVIMSILWTSGHVRAKDVKILLRLSPNANHAELDAKLQLLFSLSILNKSSHKGTLMIHLHSGFKTGLRNALTGT